MEMRRRVSTHICMTSDIGNSGNLFGGKMMMWMDEAAAIYAMWATGEKKMVTRHFSEVNFESPVKHAELVDFYCGNPRKGRTSITFDLEVVSAGETKLVAECTFVAIDDHGEKKPICWEGTPLSREEKMFQTGGIETEKGFNS